jgi:hypothetical protein
MMEYMKKDNQAELSDNEEPIDDAMSDVSINKIQDKF